MSDRQAIFAVARNLTGFLGAESVARQLLRLPTWLDQLITECLGVNQLLATGPVDSRMTSRCGSRLNLLPPVSSRSVCSSRSVAA